MTDVLISSACRTPIGSFQGALSALSAAELGAIAVREAVKRASIEPAHVERAILGNVLPAGMGQAPARQAVIKAGLPVSVGAITVNKVCGSGLQAVMFARREILVGDAQVIVAGGMESMTNAPYVLPQARSGYRMGNGQISAAIIEARGLSSAASAANAAIDSITSIITPTAPGDWHSLCVPADGSYGVEKGLIFGFPTRSDGHKVEIVQGLDIDAFSREKISATETELKEERDAVQELIPA